MDARRRARRQARVWVRIQCRCRRLRVRSGRRGMKCRPTARSCFPTPTSPMCMRLSPPARARISLPGNPLTRSDRRRTLPVNGMTNATVKICLAAFAVLILAAAACGTRQQATQRAAVTYPEPRFPSYLKPPSSLEDVLPHVRPLARNKIGFQGNGLGIAQSGDTVAFILSATAEDMIVQGVKRAMEE